MSNLFFYIIVLVSLCSQVGKSYRVVRSKVIKVKYGILKGSVIDFENDELQLVENYLGIPYASPPVKQLRYMPPVTCLPWNDVKEATKVSPVCLQNQPDANAFVQDRPVGRVRYLERLKEHLINQSEDCLYLNIYRPASDVRDPLLLPVMVYIHGESYEWNSGNPYDGSLLASFGNVVVVTLNYRLGVFGFLTTMDDSAGGNYGLMDQIAALHWIQENIKQFGGDSRNITIFGQGTGATCAHLLMISPVAKGLFQRVILMSGSSLSAGSMTKNPLLHSKELARLVGCPTNDSVSIVHCLRGKPSEELLEASLQVPKYQVPFGPVVDGVILEEKPVEQIDEYDKLYGSYELMLGVTKVEEYSFMTSHEAKLGISPSRREQLIREYIDNIESDRSRDISAMVVNEYTDWTQTVQNPLGVLDSVIEAIGDAEVVAPMVTAAQLHGELVKRKTYMYVFGHQTKQGDYSDRLGCIRGEELPYVFGAPLLDRPFSHFASNYSAIERELSEAVITMWTNFAKSGDPNSATTSVTTDSDHSNSQLFLWPNYDSINQKYLYISARPKVRDHYRAHKLSLWLNLVPQILEMAYEKPDYELQVPWRTGTSPAEDDSVTVLPSTSGREKQEANKTKDDAITATPDVSTLMDDKSRTINGKNRSELMNKNEELRYSSALSVTIAVGCSLLVLNGLAFAGMYYQKDKSRRSRNKSNRRNSNVSSKESLGTTFIPTTNSIPSQSLRTSSIPCITAIKPSHSSIYVENDKYDDTTEAYTTSGDYFVSDRWSSAYPNVSRPQLEQTGTEV